jgi:hypothetical protein
MSCQNLAEKRCSQCRIAAYCSRECQKGDWKRHKKEDCSDAERIVEVEENTEGKEVKVQLRGSDVHGRGVFATADISVGEKICFFDGDDRSLRFKVTMLRHSDNQTKEGCLGIKDPARLFGHICHGLPDVNMFAKHHNKRDVVRIGKTEPDHDFGVGQFINDGCKPNLLDKLDFGVGYKQLKSYLEDSEQKANVQMGPNYWFVASRPIRRGVELLTHYGLEFWLQKLMLESSVPAWRFYYYSLMDQQTKPFNLTKLYQYDMITCKEFLRVMLGDEEMAERSADPKWELFKLSESVNLQ